MLGSRRSLPSVLPLRSNREALEPQAAGHTRAAQQLKAPQRRIGSHYALISLNACHADIACGPPTPAVLGAAEHDRRYASVCHQMPVHSGMRVQRSLSTRRAKSAPKKKPVISAARAMLGNA